MHVFISRSIEPGGALSQFCKEKNIQITAKSLLDFRKVPAVIQLGDFDVVFFASPRSFDFFENKELLIGKTLACVGSSTKMHLEAKGYLVEFVGKDATVPHRVAAEFKSWLGNKKVLFPISDQSKRSIAQAIPKDQKEELVMYETVLVPEHFKNRFDLLVFSSPSNVQAFLELNSLDLEQKLLVFGTTTQSFLKDRGYDSEILSSPDEDGVLIFLEDYLKG